MGRIMGLDVGDVRIGIAMSDELKMIASPFEVRKCKGTEEDVRYLAELAKRQNVERIVIGLPLKLDGTDSAQTIKTRAFREALDAATGIESILEDERLTSVSAEEMLIDANVKREKRKLYIDKIAAAIILKSYLERI